MTPKQVLAEMKEGCGSWHGYNSSIKCSPERILCPKCFGKIEGYKLALQNEKEFLENQVSMIGAEIKVAEKHDNEIAKQSIRIYKMFLIQLNKRISEIDEVLK